MGTMLRKLESRDVTGMLEWMHDERVAKNFRFDFMSMTKEKALDFISHSFTDENQHFAIVDAQNNYVGTISLKNISAADSNAEYAIVLRREFWGKGYAQKATAEILDYAFNTLNLHKVYLNVLEENIRANKFYKKFGFAYEGTFKEHLRLPQGRGYGTLCWYAIISGRNENKLNSS